MDGAVVPPCAQHVQRGGKLRVSLHGVVGRFQRIGQCSSAKLFSFLIVADTEIGRQVKNMRILTKDRGAEGVDG